MNTVQLGAVASVFNGKTPSKDEQRESGHPVLKIKDVSENGSFRGKFSGFVDEPLASKYEAKWISPGDTLILNAAHNADYVASKSYLATEAVAGALPTGEWAVVRPDPAKLLPQYCHYWLRSEPASRAIKFLVKGIHLYPKDIAALAIRVPNLVEQRRIVDLLSRAENIVRMRREAEKKAKEIIPALFLEMFGDPATNPKGWPTQTFRDLGTLDRGRSRHRPRDAPHLYGGPHPFVQTGDVARSGGVITTYAQTYSDAGLAQSRLWPVGTLCITIAANIAETGVLAFEACFPDSVVGFLPGESIRTDYIQHWLHFLKPTLAAQAPQAAQKNINLEILRNLNVPVPPMSLQVVFEEDAKRLRSTEACQLAATTVGTQVFQSLLAGVFSEGMAI